MQAYRFDENLDPVQTHYSATWWTAGLIKEMIYMNLNMWQHRNRSLHNNEVAQAEITDRTNALKDAAEW